MNSMIIILNRLTTKLPSAINNDLLVQPKDYETPPPSHILTSSLGGGDSR
jgi:hypothetical protein